MNLMGVTTNQKPTRDTCKKNKGKRTREEEKNRGEPQKQPENS